MNHDLLGGIPDGVFTVDAEWRIRWFNRAAEAIAGISRQYLRNRLRLETNAGHGADLCY